MLARLGRLERLVGQDGGLVEPAQLRQARDHQGSGVDRARCASAERLPGEVAHQHLDVPPEAPHGLPVVAPVVEDLPQDRVGRELDVDIGEPLRDPEGPPARLHGLGLLAGHAKAEDEVRNDLTEPPVIAEGPRQCLGLAQDGGRALHVAEVKQRRSSEVEAQFDGLDHLRPVHREMGQCRDGLFKALGGFAVGGARDGPATGLTEIGDGLVPHLAPEEVETEGERGRRRSVRVLPFHRVTDGSVKQDPARRQQLSVGHVADAVVHEVEPIADMLEHLAANQFLHGLRRLVLVGPGRLQEQRERELPSDNGRHGRQLAARGAETLEPSGDHPSYAIRHGQERRLGRPTFRQRPERLDHHERVPLAQGPDLGGNPRENGCALTGAEESLDQRPRVLAGERDERQPRQAFAILELLQHPAQGRQVGQLFGASRHAEKHRLIGNPAPDECEQPEAHVVGPVHVLEQEQQGGSCGGGLEQSRHALEEPTRVVACGGQLRADEFGKEARQLGAPDRLQLVQHPLVEHRPSGAERVSPRAERQDLLARVAPAHQNAHAGPRPVPGQFGEQSTLADAGLAFYGHHPAAPAPSGIEQGAEPAQLALSANQRSVRREEAGPSVAVARRRPGGPPGLVRARRRPRAQDLLVEVLRLALGLDPQLAPQDGEAVLVLAQGRAPAAEIHVEAHERAVDRLLEGIESGELQGRLDSGLGATGGALVGEQSGQGLDGQLSQPLALRDEPLLERGLGHREAGEEIALVEGGSAGEVLR